MKSGHEIFRYVIVSLVFYIGILFFLFLFVDILELDKVISYVVVYCGSYFLEYIITLVFVFRERQHWIKVLRFLLYISFFLFLAPSPIR